MSVQAVVWAIEEAPDVPPHLVSLLVGLANHADPDGNGAYPTIDRLAYYTRKATRQVKDDLKKLRDLKLITLGDQRLVDHYDPRYRPVVYNLAMDRRRPRYVKQKAVPEQEPTLTEQAPGPDQDSDTPEPATTPASDAQGCSTASPGVRSTAPKPSPKPSVKTPPTPQPDNQSQPTPRGEDRLQTQNDLFDAAATAAREHQPRWRKSSVIAALQQAAERGMEPVVASAIMVELAEGTRYGPTTAGPQRILAAGPWWTPGEMFISKPRQDAAKCPKHLGELADTCRCCRGEQRGIDQSSRAEAPQTVVRTSPPKAARAIMAGIGLQSRTSKSNQKSTKYGHLISAD